MTQCYLNYIVLLLSTLFLLTNCYRAIKPLQSDSNFYELQCDKSNTTRYEYELYCGINSTVWVKFNAQDFDDTFVRYSDVQFNCYNATPLNIRLPLKENIMETADTVQFNSCRFSAKENILNILQHSLHLSKTNTVAFDSKLIDNSLSPAHLQPLNGFVEELSFKIENLSTLPLDLFVDVKNLSELSISSNSVNTSHLSSLLAPLKKLGKMILETNNVEKLSTSIFADKQFLHSLELRNATILSSNLLSHLGSLENIYLRQNSFSSLPKDLFRETKKLKQFLVGDNRVAMKQLPEGLLSNLSFLFSVLINDCGLESIPSDIFIGSKNIRYITITGNNLEELPLPLGLFVDQERLISLDLSRNMIRTLVVGLFDQNNVLKKLILSDNQLTNLPDNIFKSLTHLDHLSLENNNLLTISSDKNQPQLASIFDNFSFLKRLYLKNNSISQIPLNIMINKKYLMNIDLRFNKISSINCSFLKYFDSKINITENPLNCDYKIICLYQYIIQKSLREKFKFRTIRCGLPGTLKGRLLYDLELSQILHFPDIDQGNVSNRCSSNIRPLDSVLVMNCSDRNLSDIPTLPIPDQSFSNGIELFMHNNPLTELSSKKPKDNTNITLISISDSPIFELPEGFFSNMTKLKNVTLVLPLNKISENIFLESTAIEFLKISGTSLTSLPKSIFANQQNLTELDLSSNRLKTMSLGGFKSNRELETLKLSHNCLEFLSTAMFYELLKLKSLFLDNNSLKYVHAAVFLYTRSLEVLNMESNMLLDFEPLNTTLGALQKLLLRNNSIMDCNWLGFQDFTPALVDLSSNKISSIDLSYLGSINLTKTVLNLTGNDIETIKVPYGNISLTCDCKINSFIIDTKQKSIYDSLRCLASDNQKFRRVSSLAEEELLCPMQLLTCPKGCSCWIRPAKSILIVDCFNASLTEVPPLPELKMTFKGGIELSIEHNQLTSLKTHSKSGYKGVTKIFAAHNKITNISSEDIPESLYSLDVSNNKLERLYEGVIKVINESQNLRSVRLYQNPIKCDCLSENLTRFILMNIRLFPDIDQCVDGRKFIDLSYFKICSEEQSSIGKVIGIALIIILAALFVLTILYFNNKERILIWMYAHDICLCWVTEEELDKDKKYDAFISYSSYDGDFVAKNLVSKLESGPKSYKLCLHDRDWLGGGYIPHQIEKSVERSKRTLILMSKNYLKSRWTRLEFRTAHNASLNEKRPRVIVIMIEDDVKLENLDSDLRKYIKMYTYLRLDDPLFWDRLSYALPHPSKKNNKQSKQIKVKIRKNGGADDAEKDYSSDGINLF